MARTKAFEETEVLDKAVNIFWCKGYNGTSMQDLIDGLGISRSSLYDTFSDKRELFLATLKKYKTEQAAAMIALINNSASILQTIKELLKGLVTASIQDKENKGCFMINSTIEAAAQDADIAAIVKGNMNDIEEALTKAIKKGQQGGEINPNYSPRALARFLFNTISGLRVAAKAGVDKKVFDDIVSVTVAMLAQEENTL
jgi:TetR/AcrR family transcriptional repressor of nem operon